jgi:SulP family sulfate permease
MRKTVQPARLRGGYSWSALRHDLLAGLTVATVAVPQAMAYALIAGVPPQYGLYTAIVMTALGSLFGSSRLLINGPTNAISLVVFGAVAGLTTSPDDPSRMDLVSLLAILVGLIQVVMALLKLGDLTRYVSESVVLGFMAGAGALVALTQLDSLLGLRRVGSADDHLLVRLWRTWSEGGPIDHRALGIGLATLALVAGLHWLNRRLGIKIPELLTALVAVSLVAWLFDLVSAARGVGRLEVERRLPSLRLPAFHPDRIRQLWGGALAIALLGLVEALAIAKALAARTREPFDYNRQCLAEGIANLGAGLFRCMPGSGSLTRSAINYFAGAVTRLSGLFCAVSVAGVVLLFAPLASFIPRPALAGVLLWTAWRIVDRKRLLYCLRATRFDAGLAVATAVTAVFLSIEFSILVGTFLSFLFFVPRAARLRAAELVLGPGGVVRERQPADPECARVAAFSLEGELFFGASPELQEYLDELKRRTEAGARVLVLGLKQARNADMVCLEVLQHFLEDMDGRKVTVLLCGVRPELAQALRNLRFEHWLPQECVFLEEPGAASSALAAMRRAYELLGDDLCAACPHRVRGADQPPGDYMI